MMTIDEAIEHCKEIARDNRSKADEESRAFAIYPFINAEESATFVDRCDECADQHEQLVEWLEELKEYQELEEQNKLLKLPLMINNSVYTCEDIYGNDKYEIIEYNITNINIASRNDVICSGEGYTRNEDDEYEDCLDIEFYLSDIGKRVFLTMDEAIEQLKKLEKL